jgi:hypothetical protein
MKQFTLIMYLLLISKALIAQADTSAYNTQRKRINQLLAERSQRFGQYDNSLSKRSGIFGLKTKKDMQASNDILTQIVLTDNDIFSELKVLLDYKDFEKKEVENHAENIEGRIERFQTTITRLQQENDKLKAENEDHIDKADTLVVYLSVSVLTLLISIIYAIRSKILPKPDI